MTAKKKLFAAGGVLAAGLGATGVGLATLSSRYPQTDKELLLPGWLVSRYTGFSSMSELVNAPRSKPTAHDIDIPTHRRIDISRIMIDGPAGPLPLYIYRAKKRVGGDAGRGSTALFWLHGGGYARGSASAEVRSIADFVLTTDTVVIAPEYRTSVQAPYPAAIDDSYAALLWTRDNWRALGTNPDQLFIGGMSAGGGLAVALALKARDTGEVQLAFQLPLYPMMNDRMDTASMMGNEELIWDETKNRLAWELYLGDLFGSNRVPAYAAPARAESFAGLPPAYTFIGLQDPFLDETVDYVEALQGAGVPVTYDLYEGGFHGFDQFTWTALARTARANCSAAYQRAVETCFAPQK